MKYLVVTSTEDKTFKNVYIETDDGIKLFDSDGKMDESFEEWYSSSSFDNNKKPEITDLVTGMTYYETNEGNYSGDYEAKIRELFGK
jgi:hypothetical protein